MAEVRLHDQLQRTQSHGCTESKSNCDVIYCARHIMSAHSGHYRYARDGMQIAHALFALKAEGARGVGCGLPRAAL